ncbi:MAG: hypothetical protein IT514_09705, partial [Burkholderiales bacterium]|nr:hypothetical protein [Burkholderiales bacterium]
MDIDREPAGQGGQPPGGEGAAPRAAAPARRRRPLKALLAAAGWTVVGAYFLVAFGMLGLRYWILP